MRILVLGDSLGLPRPHRITNYSPSEKELAVNYENTYSSLMQQYFFNEYKNEKYFEIINRSKRMCTIRDVSNEFNDYLFFYEPDIIVLQIGIVDCWFRENRRQMVPKAEFEAHVSSIVSRLDLRPNCKLIIVGICPTSIKMDQRYPKLNLEISKYNDIYMKFVDYNKIFCVNMENLIDPTHLNEYILPDDHHLNPKGNKLVAGEVLKLIEGIIFNKKGFNFYNSGDLDSALDYFKRSYKQNSYYLDNLYNLLIAIYEKNSVQDFYDVADFCRLSIRDKEILELVESISREIYAADIIG